MSGLNIRDAIPSDAARIAELELATFPMPWSESALLHDIENNNLAMVLVAECDGFFAGYADVWCIAGEGQLNNIAVESWARGRRVGQSIMEEAFSRLKELGCYEISLEVRPSNEAALSLYYKLGFEEAGRREGYYIDNGEDALILRKEL